jgi:tRNA/rRNA methyltransferase
MKIKKVNEDGVRKVDHSKLHHFFDHLENELDIRGFFEPLEKKPSMLIKLRNIFHRAELSEREIASLRGVLTSLTKYKEKQEK